MPADKSTDKRLDQRLELATLAAALLIITGSLSCGGRPDSQESASITDDPPWSEAAPSWGPRARITASAIAECSGIVRSRRYPDVYWVHNDSGDSPRIFAINSRGDLLREVSVQGAEHVDWEEIAADTDGNLYICDVGNNRNARRDLVIYVIPEPDPGHDESVNVARALRFHYPDQAEFPDPAMNHDCEAVFWRDGHLYLLTKHRSDTWTRLYRMENLESEIDVGSMVTAADLSPDASELALLTYDYLFVCGLPEEGDRFLSGSAGCRLLFEARQSEAVSHEGEVIRVVNEQGEIHLLERAAVVAGGELHSPAGTVPPFARDPDASPALKSGYRPPRQQVLLEPGTAAPLALRASLGENRQPAPGPEQEASASLRCVGDELRVDVSWPAPTPEGEDAVLVMVLAWGNRSERPAPGPDDHVWGVYSASTGIDLRKVVDHSDLIPRIDLARHGDRIEGSLSLPAPTADDASGEGTERSTGDHRPCPPQAFNLNLFAPSGGEWCWGGEWSMRAPINPLLWGELGVAP
jgi:hypothetical protein